MSLYLKYRPDSLDLIKGNAEVIKTLRGMLADPINCPHAFLLHGETGCGKTTIGRIIAKELGCSLESADYKEIDSADFRGIDTIREIRKNSDFLPLESPCRIWLIDECHKLTNDAQNALLKILEDTPKFLYFILCTTEPQKLIPTIKGRCSAFKVLALNESQMFGLLRSIVRSEGETLEKEVYDQIILSGNGRPRNTIQILEQVLHSPAEERLEVAKKMEKEGLDAIELCRALLQGASWKKIVGILANLKEQEPESVRRLVLSYAGSVLIKEDNPLCGLILEEFMSPFYDNGFPQLIYACYSVTKNK